MGVLLDQFLKDRVNPSVTPAPMTPVNFSSPATSRPVTPQTTAPAQNATQMLANAPKIPSGFFPGLENTYSNIYNGIKGFLSQSPLEKQAQVNTAIDKLPTTPLSSPVWGLNPFNAIKPVAKIIGNTLYNGEPSPYDVQAELLKTPMKQWTPEQRKSFDKASSDIGIGMMEFGGLENVAAKELEQKLIPEAIKAGKIGIDEAAAILGKLKQVPGTTLEKLTALPGELATKLKDAVSSVAKPLVRPLGLGSNKAFEEEIIGLNQNKAVFDAGEMASKDSQQFIKSWNESIKLGVIKAKPLTEGQIAIDKIVSALQSAKPVRSAQEEIYTAARDIKATAAEFAGKKAGGGQAGYISELNAMKGSMERVDFTGLKLNQADIDSLFRVVDSSSLDFFDRLTAKRGLAKILEVKGGTVPTEGEITKLSQVFPENFIKNILDKRPAYQIYMQNAAEVLNVPRALMASFDMSAPLRQGLFLIGRPKQWIPAFGNMFKYFFSEDAFINGMKNIQEMPTYDLMKRAKLGLTTPSSLQLLEREEVFMSNLAEKIPGIGVPVKASGRAYSGFLNELRANTFNDMLKSAQETGALNITNRSMAVTNEKLLMDMGKFINAATGRGDLGKLNSAMTVLNGALFSPRLLASRLNLLNPRFYWKLDPFVRKEALKSLFSFATTGLTVTMLAKLGGAEVVTEPNNADFGKYKFGNTRYDPWGGFQQFIRTAAQLKTGKIISSATGVPLTLGEGYKPLTRWDVLERFLLTKASPVASFIVNMLKGTNTTGQPFTLVGNLDSSAPLTKNLKELSKSEIGQRFIPLVLQDLQDMKEDYPWLKSALMTVPAIFGVGVQNYVSTPDQIVSSANSVKNEISRMMKAGDIEGVAKLRQKDADLLIMGQKLSPIQTSINEIESQKKVIEDNVRITEEQKKTRLDALNKREKGLQVRIEALYQQLKKQKTGPNLTPSIQPTPTPKPTTSPANTTSPFFYPANP